MEARDLAVAIGRSFPAFESDAPNGLTDEIHIGVASIPERVSGLRSVVEIIEPQCTAMHVYLNGYDGAPRFLCSDRIRVYQGNEHGNLGELGKFFAAAHSRGYFLTVDDDIVYPRDYVRRMLAKVEGYRRGAIIGVHGALLRFPVSHYYRDRTTYSFPGALSTDTAVHLLGTGTIAWHTELIRPALPCRECQNMSDICLAAEAQRRAIPMICIARPRFWLRSNPIIDQSQSIYRQQHPAPRRQTELVNSIVWSIRAVKPPADSVI